MNNKTKAILFILFPPYLIYKILCKVIENFDL